MVMAVTKVAFSLLAGAVASWEGFCADSPNVCGDYCTNNPQFCDEICRADPTIRGCAPGMNCNCDTADAECLACKADLPVTEFCVDNRAVKGCDEVCCELGCSKECEISQVTLEAERQCKWWVTDQVHLVVSPRIYEANVEKDCPFEENGELHLELCQKCSKLHKPCEDEHAACGGCCGTPYHSLLNISVNTHHTCDQMKSYFKARNHVTLKCDVAPADPTVELGKVKIEKKVPVDAFDWGILKTKCQTNVTAVECKNIPLKFEFTCTDCGNKGTPQLLNQCCDKCREWAENVHHHVDLPEGVEPFVYCKGCDATHIQMTSAILPPMAWDRAGQYDDLSEAKADEKIDNYLTREVCSLLGEKCEKPEEPKDNDRRLRGDRLLEETASSNCLHYGECKAPTKLGRRLDEFNYTELTAAFDKRQVEEREARLLSGEPEPVDLNPRVESDEDWKTESLQPAVMCEQYDPSVQPTGIYSRSTETKEESANVETQTDQPSSEWPKKDDTNASDEDDNAEASEASTRNAVLALATALLIMV